MKRHDTLSVMVGLLALMALGAGRVMAYEDLLAPGGMNIDPGVRESFSQAAPNYVEDEEEDFRAQQQKLNREKEHVKAKKQPEELNHEQQDQDAPERPAQQEREAEEPATQNEVLDAEAERQQQLQEQALEPVVQTPDSQYENTQSAYDDVEDNAINTDSMLAPGNDMR